MCKQKLAVSTIMFAPKSLHKQTLVKCPSEQNKV